MAREGWRNAAIAAGTIIMLAIALFFGIQIPNYRAAQRKYRQTIEARKATDAHAESPSAARSEILKARAESAAMVRTEIQKAIDSGDPRVIISEESNDGPCFLPSDKPPEPCRADDLACFGSLPQWMPPARHAKAAKRSR